VLASGDRVTVVMSASSQAHNLLHWKDRQIIHGATVPMCTILK
jgi:hypothetical protein